MPVDLSQCPPEKNTRISPPSMWLWGILFIIIFVFFDFLSLNYFSSYLSVNKFLFWFELAGIPVLIWGSTLFFRLFIWNNSIMKAEQWNAARNNYYNELVMKGQKGLEVLKVISITPDEKGRDSRVLSNSLLPMRYTPQKKKFARYLVFHSSIPSYNNKNYLNKREYYLFCDKIKSVLDELRLSLYLIPKTAIVTVFCVLPEHLREIFNNIWMDYIQNLPIKTQVNFCEEFSSALDIWLDDEDTLFDSEQYLLLFSSVILTTEFYDNDDFDGKTESFTCLLGKKTITGAKVLPANILRRPESDYSGIRKSLLWGDIIKTGDLSGVLFSGLNEDEKNKIINMLIDYICIESIYGFIDCSLLFANSHPTSELLLTQYALQNVKPGNYLLVTKPNNKILSWSLNIANNSDGEA
ncbi:hypothetical protein [Enterobacter sp. 2VL]|uniref:hypothetical protein n=1 Tax=Enterobacter sp. 2VL TaxID=2502206 RepID=UPI0010F44E7D|nr:hypothetical protein [Enterobacter sp. 2VL]